MKRLLGLFSVGVLLLTAGCAVEAPYGGSYGVYGEYGYPTYYGGYTQPYYGYGYRHRHPYDRDHYWDRDRHFEQRRWHGEHERGHRDRD